MTEPLALLMSSAAVLVLLFAPGMVVVRALRGSWLLAVAVSPALGLALVGVTSVVAEKAGTRWSLLPWGIAVALVVLGAFGMRRAGLRLPATVLDGRLMSARGLRFAPMWVVVAAAIAIVPIMYAAEWRPDAVLERWDTLYHLSALEWVRESGSASPLTLGAVSNSMRTASIYPSAFHALVSLVPGVGVPVLLNGATLALSTVPWILGIALLARTVFPRIDWAPAAGAVLATLIPGAPLDEWIHLSPIPNLVGFAVLPGLLAAAVAMWPALLDTSSRRSVFAAVLTVGAGGLGLLLTHPNTAVMALLLLAVRTGADALRLRKDRRGLLLVPLLLLVPVAILQLTPLGGMVTEFTGGLEVPWWTGLGEVVLGLHTVWPMALGVVIAAAWWPGLVSCARDEGRRWLVAAWAVVVVLYLDATVDSPLGLSVLFYRGQDRLTMPLAMLSCILAIAGLRWWGELMRRSDTLSRLVERRSAMALGLCVALVVALTSVPTRAENAARNLALDAPGRGRFLQADELEAWDRAAPMLDHSKKVLADPFSGGAHMWAIHEQPVHFAVAGSSLRHRDKLILQAARDAPRDPTACAFLMRWDIGYVYQDKILYQFDANYAALNSDLSGLGPVVLSTSHSTLYAVQCDPGNGDTDYDPGDL